MLSAALAMFVAASLQAPLGDMDMVNHLLSKLPSVDRTDQAAGADVDLWIAPDGTIISCTTSRQVGNEDFVRLICPALEGYRTGSPKGGDGKNAYADISLPIVAFPDRAPSLREKLNAGLRDLRRVSADERYLPLNVPRWRDEWKLLIEVGEDGTVVHCTRASGKVRQTSAEQACTAVAQTTFARRTDSHGAPVRYIKTIEARSS